MTTDINQFYDMVNSLMKMMGEEPFPKTGDENDKKELKSLIDRYTERLRTKCPSLAKVPDELIPDALLQPMRAAYSKMK